MESRTVLKPKLSVIVPALRGYETVLAALDSWEAQSCRDQLEILVLCPTRPPTATLPPGQIVIETDSLELHEARCLAIRHARSDLVMLAEDHCLPERNWAERVLARMEEGWDAVGPALCSGNSGWMITQGSFLLGYGQWMNPVAGGPAAVLPGHNAVLRTGKLLELGPALERDLLVAAFLLRRLSEQGGRLYLESEAGMRHFDVPHWAKSMRIFFCVGMGFGAVRTGDWPLLGRAFYGLATPLVAAKHWWRAVTHYRRAGAQAGLSPLCLAAAAILAAAWACGEAAGAAMGIRRVTPFISFSEIKPVPRSAV